MKIRDRELQIPIIQGGMGVGVSLGELAGHVAKCGGMGVISAAHSGYREPDFETDPIGANLRNIKEEIAKAKKIADGNGLVAVNIMVATTYYEQFVVACIEGGADAIISGAGLPSELPALGKDSSTLLAPIVSSGKAAKTICRLWDRRQGVAPDFIVIEGSEAGGHLGFDRDELENGTTATLSEILADVLVEIAPFEEKYGRRIPLFVAGGVYTGQDMARYIREGASGVQIATRFIATEECDAAPAYKQAMVDATEDDVMIIKSPVGMPGRALRTPLIEKLARGERVPPKRCMKCLRPCTPSETPYCITDALIEAVKGNYEDGLFFCGSNVSRIKGISTVEKVIGEIVDEWRAAK